MRDGVFGEEGCRFGEEKWLHGPWKWIEFESGEPVGGNIKNELNRAK